MSPTIRPALTPDQWNQRRAGATAIEIVENEVHLVVRDPDDDVVSVSGADELWALVALANNALPDHDPRKITTTDVAIVNVLSEHIDCSAAGGLRLLVLAEALRDKIIALLPPR